MLRGDLRLFSDGEAKRVNEAVVHLLENTGCRVQNERLRGLLARQGARVDEGQRIVRFPPSLIEDAVAANKRQRRQRRPVDPPTECRSWMGGGALFVYDWERGTRRQAMRQDVLDLIRAGDSLPKVGSVSNLTCGEVDPRSEAETRAGTAAALGRGVRCGCCLAERAGGRLVVPISNGKKGRVSRWKWALTSSAGAAS